MNPSTQQTGLWRDALGQLDRLLQLEEAARAQALHELLTTQPQLHPW